MTSNLRKRGMASEMSGLEKEGGVWRKKFYLRAFAERGFREEQKRSKGELIGFGPGMISTLFCVFSVQKVLSFYIYIAFRTIG